MSCLTHYRSFWGQFYRSDDPTNSVMCHSTEGEWLVNQVYQSQLTKS